MNRREIVMFTIYLGAVFALEPPCKNKDGYQYNIETDAFYKLHVQLKNYDDAKQTCINEGAELMIPASQLDVMQYQKMINPRSGEVWIGQEELPKGKQPKVTTESNIKKVIENPFPYFETRTETLYDAMTRNGDIIVVLKMRELPFICKVKAEDVPFNYDCDLYGKDYECDATIGSCYKLSKFPMTWVQAYLDCKIEDSHLVILNSEYEQQVVLKLMAKLPNVGKNVELSYFHIGFRANKTFNGAPRVFRTIYGETLEEAGYDKWSKGEPSNQYDDEYCGSIYYGSGKLNDLPCDGKDYPYICEKEIPQKIVPVEYINGNIYK